MVRPPRSDRTLRISELARELKATEWEDEDTLVEVPPNAPVGVKHGLPFLLAVPPKHRAPLLVFVLLLAAGLAVLYVHMKGLP